jgi:hypothetical protein
LCIHGHCEQAWRDFCWFETQLTYTQRIGNGPFRVHFAQQGALSAGSSTRGQRNSNTCFSNATFASDKEQLT